MSATTTTTEDVMTIQTTRDSIAGELMQGCPEEGREDHETVAQAILLGWGIDSIMGMEELNRWPETYSWLRGEFQTMLKNKISIQ